MTQTHPITPSPELVHQWHKEACKDPYHGGTFFESKTLKHVATQAAQWGADHQLKTCCKVLDEIPGGWGNSRHLLHVCRPKPPSVKEQALQLLKTYNTSGVMLTADQADTIRRALEALDG
jgi:hypothetical protein